jgi:hypothetical protein
VPKAQNRLTWSLAWQGRGGGGEWVTGYFSKNNRAIQLLAGPLAPQRWRCSKHFGTRQGHNPKMDIYIYIYILHMYIIGGYIYIYHFYATWTFSRVRANVCVACGKVEFIFLNLFLVNLLLGHWYLNTIVHSSIHYFKVLSSFFTYQNICGLSCMMFLLK